MNTAPEPHAHGLLDVGDGQQVYWESVGDPAGPVALMVHGGPGSGCSVNMRRAFPAHWRTVLVDQRGCGRSLPDAADPAVSLAANTTAHLVADLEWVREHLGVDRWLLHGGSWGSTLALVYAQTHPSRVRGLLLVAATLSRPSDIDWLYRGVGRLLPGPWAAFRDHLPVVERDDLVAGYARRMDDPDPDVRAAAAIAWLTWEDAVFAHESAGRPGAYSDRLARAQQTFVRICAHYFAHSAFLAETTLLDGAHRLAGIPGMIVHGRLDLGCPLDGPWRLAQAWPDVDLVVVDDAGHTGSPAFRDAVRAANTRLTEAISPPPG